MTITTFAFGHKIFSVDGRNYFYADNHQAYEDAEPRACPKCKKMPTEDGHDPCIANLPGVAYACCGHGVDDAYVKFPDGTVITGEVSKMPAIVPDGKGGWDLVEKET
jgi:hypothetical protein